jgi:putative addiction module killer protein
MQTTPKTEITIKQSVEFAKWFRDFDMAIKIRILKNVFKLSQGNFSHCEPVGNGVHELKFEIQHKGFRIYFCNITEKEIKLLWGGGKQGKKAQQSDIEFAKEVKKGRALC